MPLCYLYNAPTAGLIRTFPLRRRRTMFLSSQRACCGLLMAVWASTLAMSNADLDMQASCEQRHGAYFKVEAANSGFKLVATQGSGVQVARSVLGMNCFPNSTSLLIDSLLKAVAAKRNSSKPAIGGAVARSL